MHTYGWACGAVPTFMNACGFSIRILNDHKKNHQSMTLLNVLCRITKII